MATDDRTRRILEDLARELDLCVFRLELAPPDSVAELNRERQRTRRTLEQVRDGLLDLVHGV